MADLGRSLLILGGVLIIVGGALWLGGGLGLGRLPGDLNFRVGNSRVFIPIVTSILLSVVLTVLLNVFLRR